MNTILLISVALGVLGSVILLFMIIREKWADSERLKRLNNSLYRLWEVLEKDENYSKNPRIMKILSELKESTKD